MSQQDFEGTWKVHRTSGTPFGYGTEIVIGPQSVHLGGSAVESEYLEEANLLRLTEVPEMHELMLGLFVDPQSGERMLYGGGRSAESGKPLVVCTAEGTTTSAAPTPAAASASAQNFTVVATSGTQFGVDSKIRIDGGGETTQMTIDNALEMRVADLTMGGVEGSAGTLKGEQQQVRKLTVQCFRVTLEGDGFARLFGTDLVGDPENSGVWGADEDIGP